MARLKGMFLRGRSWWLRYTPTPGAKQARISLDTTNEHVAAVRAVQILQNAPLERSQEFLAEMEEYFADQSAKGNLSNTTVPMRRTTLMAFSRDMGVQRISELTLAVVERWVRVLQKGQRGDGGAGVRGGVSAGTVKCYVFHLRAFCKWLVKKNRMRENPAAKIELGKVERVVRKRFVVNETVRRLIAEAPDDDLRFILFCGFHAGMRKLEIIEAPPEWFHLEPDGSKRRGRIHVERTAFFTAKDKEERTIPLTTDFEAFLRGYLARLAQGARWVLRPDKKHGKHRYRYDFRRPFAEYMAAQGVKCTPHDMRRSFVSNKLIENSSLILKLAKWTGADVKVLQDHYAHLLADDEDIEAGV